MRESRDSLGDRMKGYENANRPILTPRVPIILRLDGWHFHTYLQDATRPFDQRIMDLMDSTMQYLFREFNAIIGYTQSDEISLVLWDGRRQNSQGWFGNNSNKLVSLGAAMASVYFSKFSLIGDAHFDARAFSIPEDEVSNYFLWRYRDWVRNSVSMYAQAHYSHKELHGKKQHDLHELLYAKGLNWAHLSPRIKNGAMLHHSDPTTFIYADPMRIRADDAFFFRMPREEE